MPLFLLKTNTIPMAFKRFTASFFACLLLAPLAWSQHFNSVLQFGDTGFDNISVVDIDKNGNKYISGYFSGTTKFGSKSLTSDGGVDIFVAKLDKDDKVKWVNQIGSSGNDDEIHDLAIDASGNVYVLGSYVTSIVVDDGMGGLQATNTTPDVFFVQYDNNGGVVYAGNFGFTVAMTARGIGVSSTGKVYATGEYNSASSDPDIWISRLPMNSNTPWVELIGGSDPDYVNGLEIDASDNINIAGAFSGTIELGDFSTNTMTATGGFDGFIISVSDDLDLVSMVRIPGEDANSFSSIYDLLIDGSDIYIEGAFGGEISFANIDLDAGATYVQTFYAKLEYTSSTANYAVVYADKIGGAGDCRPGAVGYNSEGDMYVTGYFEASLNYGSGQKVTSNGDHDIYVAKMDEDGEIVYILSAGSDDNNDRAFALNVHNDVVTIGGFFTSDVSFSDIDVVSEGSGDMFLATVSDVSPSTSIYEIPESVCQGEEFDVRVSGVLLEKDNVFEIYLSDENGDFTNRVLLDTIESDTGGTATVKVPKGSTAGTGYKIHVETTLPELNQTSKTTMEVFADAEDLLIIGRIKVDPLDEESYSVKDIAGSTFYWEVDNGNQIAGGSTNSIRVQWANDGQGKIRAWHETADGCKSEVEELLVDVGTFVTLPEVENEIALFPVPASNMLYVNGVAAEQMNAYTIYDLRGTEVKSDVFTGTTSIDISMLESGAYVIKMQLNDAVIVKEFQKL